VTEHRICPDCASADPAPQNNPAVTTRAGTETPRNPRPRRLPV
jgi:hypothetical protein